MAVGAHALLKGHRLKPPWRETVSQRSVVTGRVKVSASRGDIIDATPLQSFFFNRAPNSSPRLPWRRTQRHEDPSVSLCIALFFFLGPLSPFSLCRDLCQSNCVQSTLFSVKLQYKVIEITTDKQTSSLVCLICWILTDRWLHHPDATSWYVPTGLSTATAYPT